MSKSSWALLFIGICAGVINTLQVILLAVAEQRWPANIAMRRAQRITDAIAENGPKVIGLTYFAAYLAWSAGRAAHNLAGIASLPERDWVVLQAIGGLFIVDFGDYWAHRLQHRVDWLWRRHAVHHSVKEFSLFGAAKIHWVDTPFVVLPGFFAMGAFGASLLVAATTIVFWFALTTVLHVNAKLSLGAVLDGVFQVPAVHHRHHELDHAVSFGGVFCLFDRLFGTWLPPGDFQGTVGLGPRHPSPRELLVASALTQALPHREQRS